MIHCAAPVLASASISNTLSLWLLHGWPSSVTIGCILPLFMRNSHSSLTCNMLVLAGNEGVFAVPSAVPLLPSSAFFFLETYNRVVRVYVVKVTIYIFQFTELFVMAVCTTSNALLLLNLLIFRLFLLALCAKIALMSLLATCLLRIFPASMVMHILMSSGSVIPVSRSLFHFSIAFIFCKPSDQCNQHTYHSHMRTFVWSRMGELHLLSCW